MKSKYELTISTKYVPDWSYVQAIRELFQNALDNEIKNPANKMEFDYNSESEVLRISNKTSILEIESLLLGNSTKANDKDTIGQHGEGYKIAFMVLLRENKKIKVYNYGKKEIWEAKLVRSRRYNNNLVPVVIVEKGAFWKQVPDNDLIVEITGINPEEYEAIVESNLNLQDGLEYYEVKDMGKILLDKSQKGKIYVCGLYICSKQEFNYGYSFNPSIISLDRDRRLMSTIDVAWETSLMWKKAFADDFMKNEILEMMNDGATDVHYMESRAYLYDDTDLSISNALAKKFIEENGENAVPVDSNSELSRVNGTENRPVMVNSLVKNYIKRATAVELPEPPPEINLKEEFQKLLDDIEHKLDNDDIERFIDLIEKI